jgi:hypothetical protein
MMRAPGLAPGVQVGEGVDLDREVLVAVAEAAADRGGEQAVLQEGEVLPERGDEEARRLRAR